MLIWGTNSLTKVSYINQPSITTRDVLERYEVPIEREDAKGNFICYCMFHNDSHNPNFSISSTEGIYKCWSCGAKGNLVNLVAHFENISTKEAYKLLLNFEKAKGSSNILKPLKLNEFQPKLHDTKRFNGLLKVLYEILYYSKRPNWHSLILGNSLYERLETLKTEVEYCFNDNNYKRVHIERSREHLDLCVSYTFFESQEDRYAKLLDLISSNPHLDSYVTLAIEVNTCMMNFYKQGFTNTSVKSKLYSTKFIFAQKSLAERCRVLLFNQKFSR